MSNVKHMTQVTSPPMGEVADGAKQIGGDGPPGSPARR